MEWWLNATMLDVEDLIPVAQAAEESGFAGLSMGDHLVFPEEIASPYPYSSDGGVRWGADTHWPDAWVAIGAMAAVTRTLKFTTGVYVAPLRHPFHLAKALSTASQLSGNRVIGGFGAGWMKEEFDMLGLAFEARGGRLDELLETLRLLWTGEVVEFHGQHFDFPAVRMRPPSLGRIPILIGGHAPPALRRAAREDGWIGVHRDFEETGRLIAKLRALHLAEPTGRDCTVMLNIMRASDDDLLRFNALGVNALVLPVLALPGEQGLAGRLQAIRRAGAELGLTA